ncbi:acyl transferase/acyl hydrolase/lysophospholipase [Hygrophoropsis aurantiaca]|uniref:Acyl transferase/acyl hydrolase/lysophospholipase n=1 Tax=Hygrophoropsis aurantiaca TaxID=72124 RepID=A0ACB7ZUZ1_9AGAM|nr:acyl transferase/acyl hydrolase/lysophospholipase [Hygrophoropsis aurantiaca]
MWKVRNVLSIDGCGFRGYTQLLILNRLMQKIGNDTGNRELRPCEVFDIICGTATGGLIAILLGSLRMSCRDAIVAYNELEEAIFGRHPTLGAILAHNGPFDTTAFQQRLATLVERRAGDRNAPMLSDKNIARAIDRLNNEHHDNNTIECKTFVTVVSKSTAVDTDAQRIRSYTLPNGPNDLPEPEIVPGHNWLIREAAIGTTSCPRLFSPMPLGAGDEPDERPAFMAANVSGFSNPSMIAYLEAMRIFGKDLELTLISLGMGLRNRHDYGSATKDGIDRMINQLNFNNIDPNTLERFREFICQTQLVATGTQLKHLRLADLIRRKPGKEYYRFDPPRNVNRADQNPFIFVDYVQKENIETITNDFFQQNTPGLWSGAVDAIQRAVANASRWMKLEGFTHTTDRPIVGLNLNNMKPLGIMRECYRWEQSNANYISCFSIAADGNVHLITGSFDACPAEQSGSTLYVRILLNDQWRFFSRYTAFGADWDWGNGFGSCKDPIETIQAFQGNPEIRAFRSDGVSTTSTVAPEQVNIHEFSFALPYYGTWIYTP